MTRILMVCLGNICRSPLAEGILKSKITSLNIQVDSAGTAAYHIGKQPDPRSVSVARKYDIDIGDQRARQFNVADFDRFDQIYVMDHSNYQNVIRLARHDNDKRKVKRILDHLQNSPYDEVPDPYYGGENGFEKVYQMLDRACNQLVKELQG
ncbi:MAG: low molecular weight phosphotyrosine protein phosphatase [Flavobacteriaceae bacterium]|nr:low molecular weight phosphotyrosine protein phosphatase [Bacteroidia bacterium]NNF74798.1 low molecular weight phosphotyrosine protein phosphatase [Flavobacteriaceae bacterium]NNK74171.1 low molecular weight phosphotyrosine protein phosphatase [Flavobacteriaceae bacterium]